MCEPQGQMGDASHWTAIENCEMYQKHQAYRRRTIRNVFMFITTKTRT